MTPWRYAKEMVAVDPWGVALGALVGLAVGIPLLAAIYRLLV